MQYAALFIWLSLCLLLGGMMHYVMAGALSHRPVQLLAAPGMFVRKFVMTLAALVFGGTVTRVRIYELSSRDIDFRADGVASIAKVMVPLAPLFGAAVAAIAVNGLFGAPLDLECAPPALASLSGAGLQGFLAGTWALLSDVVRQAIRSDWGSLRLYVIFALLFSLALGASASLERIREAAIGAALLSATLAVLSTIAIRRAGVVAASPGWFSAARDFVVNCSGVAFVMMVYGMFAAVVVGVIVRVAEVASGRGSRRRARKADRADDEEAELRRAA